jgi:hypothetical protein
VAASSINVTEGSGKRLSTNDRTISSVLVQEQFVLPAEFPYPSYIVAAENVSTATADSHMLEIMAGSSSLVRIRSIRIEQRTNAGSASTVTFQVLRLTTAGTGGTALTPAKFDTASAASGCTAMTLPSSKGTESTLLMPGTLSMRTTTNVGVSEDTWVWTQHPGTAPITLAAGTSNGIAIKNTSSVATGTWNIIVELVETSF